MIILNLYIFIRILDHLIEKIQVCLNGQKYYPTINDTMSNKLFNVCTTKILNSYLNFKIIFQYFILSIS